MLIRYDKFKRCLRSKEMKIGEKKCLLPSNQWHNNKKWKPRLMYKYLNYLHKQFELILAKLRELMIMNRQCWNALTFFTLCWIALFGGHFNLKKILEMLNSPHSLLNSPLGLLNSPLKRAIHLKGCYRPRYKYKTCTAPEVFIREEIH